ncbi:hypothetical protein A4S06_04225 [Erysipelotrichaceae bacterium MTC7]|nr:hypothetical protein A4S06_04225 [Erysipelotrichaceae bacterium MTC7]
MKGKIKYVLLGLAVLLACFSIFQTEFVIYATELEYQTSLQIADIANNFNLISLMMVIIMISVLLIVGYFAKKYKRESKASHQ